ncbi:MAG: carbon monoxide dehydrogenase subunit G [Deltaproteobacteria bacterium]|nr:carbon monoxide dehydrogenase subunit G [Deltaproteobacteria bacterium]MBW2546666.1 carbon monoxide dehydrogenase subunit G [Deltaproteobacteria bacterium]MBW2717202.1 carbon monoxide dehydrogenase subunit G [Deltaproteobacteria bacterium]
MKFSGEYEFEAPIAEVWKALLDPVVLAAVMPGCEKLELVDDAYVGELNIKVGPVQGKFQGKVNLSDVEEEKGYTMKVDGRGAPGFVKATASVKLTPEGDATKMEYDADAQVGGRIASVGQRLIDASAKAIIKESLEGLNANVKARANVAEGEVAEVVQASQAEFATRVAKEVAKDLIPPPVRTALLVLALVGVVALIYLLVR